MAKVTSINANFTAGELSPALRGRTDLAKYFNGCETLENMICRPHGPAVKRPGTYFVREVMGRDHVTNGAFAAGTWTLGTGWSIVTGKAVGVAGTESALSQDPGDLTEAEVYELIYTLSDRTAGTITSSIGGTDGTTVTANDTYTERITCGATTVIALTKSADFAGKIDDVSVRRVAPKARLESFTFSTLQSYILEFTDLNLRVYKDKGIILDGTEPLELTTTYAEADLFELQVTQSADTMYIAHPTYPPRKLTRTSHTAWTIADISFTASPFTGADAYPACVDFYEQRLLWARTNDDPQTIWASKSGDYENMTTGTEDDDAFVYTIAAKGVNQIQWMVPQNIILIGTKGAEWKMGASGIDEPMSVTNVSVKRQSTWGSKNLQALLINDVVLFIQRAGTKIRELTEDPTSVSIKYVAPDLTILAEHITAGGIVDWASQQEPTMLVWSVRSDGVLLGLTYERTQDVVGWHRHLTNDGDDLFESVAVIPTTDEDEVWVVVQRTIGGVVRRYVEYFKPWNWGSDRTDCFFVDSGLTSDNGVAMTITGATKADPVVITVAVASASDDDYITINGVVGMTELNGNTYKLAGSAGLTYELQTVAGVDIDGTGFTTYVSDGSAVPVAKTYSGLTHLVGRTVTALTDGFAHPDCVVDADGEITLDDYYNKVHAGLPYSPSLRPMNLEAGAQAGTAQGKTKRTNSITVRFQDTIACKVGSSEADLEEIAFRSDVDPMDEPLLLFTGDKKIEFPGGYETDGTILITNDTPLPLTVVSIMPELRTYE